MTSCNVQEQLRMSDDVQFFHDLVDRLNSQIHGFKVCAYLLFNGVVIIEIAVKKIEIWKVFLQLVL